MRRSREKQKREPLVNQDMPLDSKIIDLIPLQKQPTKKVISIIQRMKNICSLEDGLKLKKTLKEKKKKLEKRE